MSSDDWEDCDLDDDTEDFELIDKTETSSYDMINSTTSKGKDLTESESFTLLESKSGNKTATEHIGDSHSSIKGDDNTNSVTSWRALNHQIRGSKRGKTRLEAFQELDIEKPEILSTGEIKLASGKIIGHRSLRHIYRQRVVLPDEREAVMMNKLAIEYRKMQNGGQLMLWKDPRAEEKKMLDKAYAKGMVHENKRQ